jgi:hypothetical protein
MGISGGEVTWHTKFNSWHLTAVPSGRPSEGTLRIFCYLKKHIKFKLVLDHRLRDMEQFDFKFDWERYCRREKLIPNTVPIHLETLYR